MPYVPDYDRDILQRSHTSGQLTWVLTEIVLRYLGPKPRFEDFAQVLGALEATKLELYRRSMAEYEDQKRKEHGDLNYPYRRTK